uniref:Uncharacterized protein n=1 Tax=Octopus bimaculoides TaxID=37653 RepID=A0A0L8G6C7_OCTBM
MQTILLQFIRTRSPYAFVAILDLLGPKRRASIRQLCLRVMFDLPHIIAHLQEQDKIRKKDVKANFASYAMTSDLLCSPLHSFGCCQTFFWCYS